MQNKNIKYLLCLAIGFLLGFVACKLITKNQVASFTSDYKKSSSNQNSNSNTNNNFPNKISNTNKDTYNRSEKIPQKAIQVLQYIKENQQAMPGYVGGRIFSNRERKLPMEANGTRITYQEWDVNQKVEGRNRGTERIVTGSDGRSWYTNDHYKTFTLMK